MALAFSSIQNSKHREMWDYVNKHLSGDSSVSAIRTALCKAGYPSEDVSKFLVENVLSSLTSKEKGDDVSKVFTPFGVMVGDAGAYKSFDNESFYEEVLKPSEKAMYDKYKKDFLKKPKPDKVSAGFIPWQKLIVQSKSRNHLMLNKIMSNTWALNKEAIPGFIDLIEKLRSKYSTVLGDDKLLEYLEAAQHRARELEVSGDVSGSSSKSETNSSLKVLKSACHLKLYSELHNVSQSAVVDAAGIPVLTDSWDSDPCLYVGTTPVWIEEGLYSDQFGRQKGYIVSYQAPFRDWCSKLAFPLGTSLEEIEDEVASAVEQDIESDEEFDLMASSRRVFSDAQVDQQAYNNYVQQLVAMGMPEDQARQQADQMVAQIKQNTAQFVQNIQQPNQQGVGLAASFKRYFKSGNKRVSSGLRYNVSDVYKALGNDRGEIERFYRELEQSGLSEKSGVITGDEADARVFFRSWGVPFLKDTPFMGTYEDEDGALYMPDDEDYYDEDDYEEVPIQYQIKDFISDYTSELKMQADAIHDGVMTVDELRSWIEEQLSCGYKDISDLGSVIFDEVVDIFGIRS